MENIFHMSGQRSVPCQKCHDHFTKWMKGDIMENEEIVTSEYEGSSLFCRDCCASLIEKYGCNDDDILLVAEQGGVDQETAIGALILNEGDVVNAIVDLADQNNLKKRLAKLCKEDCPNSPTNFLVKSAAFK